MANLQLLDSPGGDIQDTSVAAKRIHTVLLRRINEVGQANIATGLGVSASWVSRFKSNELEHLSQFLAAMGLKVVPAEARRYDEPTLSALLTLAKQRMGQLQTADHLAFEDDE